MISNETIKRNLRKGLSSTDGSLRDLEPIQVNNIRFSKVNRTSIIILIDKIYLSLDDINGIELGQLKEKIDHILSDIGVTYAGILLDI